MKEIAENHLKLEVDEVVMAVPYHFNDSERSAINEAAILAGLDILKNFSESFAAAIAYNIQPREQNIEKYSIVMNLGANFEVSIVLSDYVMIETMGTSKDPNFGGDQLNERLAEYIVQEFERKIGRNISRDSTFMEKIMFESERIKVRLSEEKEIFVNIKSFYEGLDFNLTITRAKFEELNQDLFLKTLEHVDKVLKGVNITISEIDECILYGGSSKIPKVQELIQDYFKGKQIRTQLDASEVLTYSTSKLAKEYENYKKNKMMMCCNPFNIGVGVVGGVIKPIVLKCNVMQPFRKSEIFSTQFDNQPSMLIQIYEGLRTFTKDNIKLCEFEFSIPLAPRGVPQIQISIEEDANGKRTIKAKDLNTGVSKKFKIVENKRYSQQEIDSITEESEKNFEKDQEIHQKNFIGNFIEPPTFKRKHDEL
jgi:molecular chaperone DnaK (HSP70)